VWIPAGVPPHREVEDDPGADKRYEMCELTVATDERFALSRVEIEREGPSYTADTLRELRAQEPEAELFLILGSDAAAGLPTWERADEVRRLATIAVMTRPEHEGGAPPPGWQWIGVDVPQIEVSSTDIRARIAAGKPVDFLVPEGVLRVVEEHRLYGSRR
jgi:nicotinate-nucleotide adenylyltransferase